MKLTLEQSFGKGAFQNEQFLYIRKTSLKGLKPLPQNTAESLFVSMICTLKDIFEGVVETPEGVSLTTPSGEFLEYDNSSLYELLKVWLWKTLPIRQNNQSIILFVLVFDWFVSPPPEIGLPLHPQQFHY